jgi:hypothetical protein
MKLDDYLELVLVSVYDLLNEFGVYLELAALYATQIIHFSALPLRMQNESDEGVDKDDCGKGHSSSSLSYFS